MTSSVHPFPSYPWKVSITDSIDGKPLSITISDLFFNFPHERLPSNPYVALTLRQWFPWLVVGLYFAAKPLMKTISKKWAMTGESKVFRTCVAIHNLILALFSGIVFINVCPLVARHVMDKGFMSMYCNRDGEFWEGEGGLGGWSIIFYWSKYYELLDTFVLILKGKKPSVLQVYHHACVPILFWATIASHAAWVAYTLVLYNSAIHAAMYGYYFLKTVSPSRNIKAAKYLTAAQIVQFVVGNTLTLGIQIMGDACDSQASRFVLAIGQVFVFGLIIFFSSFAINRYGGTKLSLRFQKLHKNKQN